MQDFEGKSLEELNLLLVGGAVRGANLPALNQAIAKAKADEKKHEKKIN